MPSSPENPAPFKNRINPEAADQLATSISTVYPPFDKTAFKKSALENLETLELKERVQQFSSALQKNLPPSIPQALKILTDSLPPALRDCETISGNWHLWPIAQFIEDHGLPHREQSIAALTEITQRFTAEFAIRPFIISDPERTLADLQKLTIHPNPHVRRWCSEGARPRLPWGKQIHGLIADPTPLFPILERLKNDPELYVRRSVANSLNDIAKDHPALIVKTCAEWQKQNNSDETKQLIKHALRTLIKNGNPAALKLIGYSPPKNITAKLALEFTTVKIGNSLTMTLSLNSSYEKQQNLLIDYAVTYIRKAGKTSHKVFKWKALTIPSGAEIAFSKKHSFRLTTIRALYPGPHSIEILINGQKAVKADFAVS